MLDSSPEAAEELQKLKAERAEISALTSERIAATAVGKSTGEKRAKLVEAIRALGVQEHLAMRAWLDGGRQGEKPVSRDAERARLHAELVELRDDDLLQAENAAVASRIAEEYSRHVGALTRRIESVLHARVEEHVAAALASHAEALETVSISLAKLGGLQRGLFELANSHARSGRRELESAVLTLADGLNNQDLVRMREAPETAAQTQKDFAELLARLRA